MARRPSAAKLRLAEQLDLTAAGPLHAELLARRGRKLSVDAAGVRIIGAPCVQVLLAAAATWAADGVPMRVVEPSPDLLEALRLFGIPPEALHGEEAAR